MFKKYLVLNILLILIINSLFADVNYNNSTYKEFTGSTMGSPGTIELAVNYHNDSAIFPFKLYYGEDSSTNYIDQNIIINNAQLVGTGIGQTDNFYIAVRTFFSQNIQVSLTANGNFKNSTYDTQIPLIFHVEEGPNHQFSSRFSVTPATSTNQITFNILCDNLDDFKVSGSDYNKRIGTFRYFEFEQTQWTTYKVAKFWITWDKKESLPTGNYSATVTYEIKSID